MKTREEVARFVESQFNGDHACALSKGDPKSPFLASWRYGRQDVRELIDFIFESAPATEEEKVG